MNYYLLNRLDQGRAEDLILWHRYNYYVLGIGLISDKEYDMLEQSVKSLWSVSIVTHGPVGSDMRGTYPEYIRENRRPDFNERAERDYLINKRWMEALI